MSRNACGWIAAGLIMTLGAGSALAQRPKLQLGATKRPDPPKEQVPDEYKDVPPVLRFKMRDIDGKEVNLKEFQGNVIMMVNVASKCGFTPQYKSLQEIYAKYKDQGFVILAFPSNDFNNQEPGDAAEIKQFCTDKYKVTFTLFDKVAVKDKDTACDLYKFLTGEKTDPKFYGAIKWNFTKFLIDRRGTIRARFESRVDPADKKVTDMIERLLKAKAPKKPGDKAVHEKPAPKKAPADKAGAPQPKNSR